jgi:hypothetical protein
VVVVIVVIVVVAVVVEEGLIGSGTKCGVLLLIGGKMGLGGQGLGTLRECGIRSGLVEAPGVELSSG